MASSWHDLGIQLQVKDLDNYKSYADPTKAKYERMLKGWLKKQTGKKLEILKQFRDALVGIDLNADAETFQEKASKVFEIDWPPDIN